MTDKTALGTLFDTIYVVSLPASTDRRTYITQHLTEAGIDGYVFHDACGPDHPDVVKMIGSGKVMSYPPCFRCGKLSCGREDCNNVLIPPQIATFVTYLKLWERIAATPQIALVIEDDLALNPYWPQVIGQLAQAVAQGDLVLDPQVPRLLRMGWAKNPDHSADVPFRLDPVVRMSNPCHALSSAYARALLDRFQTLDTTADVFMHQQAPLPGEALTVFPPLASELSWSTGALESLIHPKEIRATFLAAQGRTQEAEAMRERAAHHMRHVAHRTEKDA